MQLLFDNTADFRTFQQSMTLMKAISPEMTDMIGYVLWTRVSQQGV